MYLVDVTSLHGRHNTQASLVDGTYTPGQGCIQYLMYSSAKNCLRELHTAAAAADWELRKQWRGVLMPWPNSQI